MRGSTSPLADNRRLTPQLCSELIDALACRRLAVIAVAAPAQPPLRPSRTSRRRVRADVEFLASDNLEGRDTGSRGYAIAADYVASQFRAIGLEPAGEKGGWFQQVPFRRASLRHSRRVLTLTIGGQAGSRWSRARTPRLRPSVTEQVAQAVGRLRVRRLWPQGRALRLRRLSRARPAREDRGRADAARRRACRATSRRISTPARTGSPPRPARSASSKCRATTVAGAADPVARGGRPLIDWVDRRGQGRLGPAGPAGCS